MADQQLVVTAQLHVLRSAPQSIEVSSVSRVIREAMKVAPLDILIAGGDEVPDLYRMLTAKETRLTDQVFLWFPALSDYPGMEPEHLVVDYQGAPSRGWGDTVGSGDIGETFQFACPNNPTAQATTLQALQRLLTTYEFDGVFLDKIRFPSPANGFSEILSCFCTHCQQAASQHNLDLDDVRQALLNPFRANAVDAGTVEKGLIPSGAAWLNDLLDMQPLLQRFIRFRADSITRLVKSIHQLTEQLGKQLSFDLFAPGLAPLVGQDYSSLAAYAEWCKPMIYRYAKGPAGLSLEIPSLVSGLQTFLGHDSATAWSWIQKHVGGMLDTTIQQIDAEGVPVKLIADETRQAVELMGSVPVYLGVEAVSIPEFAISITPDHVRDMLTVTRDAGAAGVALSWDLMHMPLDNLRVLGAAT